MSYPVIDGLNEIQGLDVAVDGRSIHALLVGKPADGGRSRVVHVHSEDGGQTWTPPNVLNRPDDPPVIARRGNDARLAVKGKDIVAAWQTQGELPGTGPMSIVSSRDGGNTWTRGDNPATGDSLKNQAYLSLVADPQGEFHLVWLDDREETGDTQGLRYASSKDGGLHWGPEATLDPAVCTCCWSRLEVLPDGTLSVLYRDADPRDMKLVLRPGQTGGWRPAGPVGAFGWHFTGCPHCGGGLAGSKARNGRAMLHSVVWTGKEDSAGLFYLKSADAGRNWSAPRKVGDGHSRDGDIAALDRGTLAIAFTRDTPAGTSVQLTQSGDEGGHWTDPAPLTGEAAKAQHPRILATPFGFRVFWTETRPGGRKTWAMAAPRTETTTRRDS
ncbi:sialidase family protein [Methylococcus geothermalis]|uniref:sialidase family protein n=1 Tax=Methylococcus geothermalis TaxID=2681310 RepID=UPI001E4D5668|nr:sialidase family protein [Methylococcus geothermalis]